MSMLRSLQSGISGLKGFQTELDVVGNNIANVNTTGFKKSRISFADAMNDTLSHAQKSQNGEQVGLGTNVGAIDTLHTNGVVNRTSNPLDVAINGSGYFILSSPDHPSTDPNLFTRDGSFHLNNNGFLVNANGLFVQGRLRDSITGEVVPPFGSTVLLDNIKLPKQADLLGDNSGKKLIVSSVSISDDGIVRYRLTGDDEDHEAGPIALARFPNPQGLEKMGNNIYQDNAASGDDLYDLNTEKKIIAGALEASNVDLTDEMTELINAQRAYQSNARVITSADQILQELVQLKR
ncbi:flagellar hook-basal body complex protein [Sporolactobacillus laevolacticus]|uniref:Flagellar hook protein FlgE n=1 Tax=Sporolactobacillus laevolacticus DSM 442 TaxID=1395513 RepID=V6IXC3_9BACL|nr:flagellar hook-basal body complex protein [Sporolactobacillus laevolacticus]EST11940.1 flagellar basal body rod protein FlgG [Sporolactobacillus laevolacticus DSM 442]